MQRLHMSGKLTELDNRITETDGVTFKLAPDKRPHLTYTQRQTNQQMESNQICVVENIKHMQQLELCVCIQRSSVYRAAGDRFPRLLRVRKRVSGLLCAGDLSWFCSPKVFTLLIWLIRRNQSSSQELKEATAVNFHYEPHQSAHDTCPRDVQSRPTKGKEKSRKEKKSLKRSHSTKCGPQQIDFSESSWMKSVNGTNSGHIFHKSASTETPPLLLLTKRRVEAGTKETNTSKCKCPLVPHRLPSSTFHHTRGAV